MRRLFSIFFFAFSVLFISCHNKIKTEIPINGVSKILNDQRYQEINRLIYTLHFRIPEDKSQTLQGVLKLSFIRKKTPHPLVLDFQNTSSHIKKITVNEKNSKYEFANGHIIIPANEMKTGLNKLRINFIAGNQALNRNDDFLYTLFVPGKASTAFPCMDQPDLKAVFRLSLNIPKGWVAIANSKELTRKKTTQGTEINFKKTKPISTYLFSFVVGKFKLAQKTVDHRLLKMYYRETDSIKVKQNMDEVFKLEAHALSWMEKYTGISYPFGKFDFVLIPAFQYSGMEHPGAVLYRASRVFLDPSATQTQKLFRASLIAHETAHMWFGDLVTMKWFDDVWLKEVFANFMAAKIAQPTFPEINHRLSFLIDHYPKAYAVDRTPGANAVKQKLENLNMAGMLYGAIIYHKAPIVMMKLEDMIGKEKFRTGLQEYLKKFRFSNADWDDLIEILDKKTSTNLKAWSHVWVKENSIPHYTVSSIKDQLIITQSDPQDKGRIWPQKFHYLLISGSERDSGSFFNHQKKLKVQLSYHASLVLLNANGKAYGFIRMTPAMKKFIKSNSFMQLSPIQRATAYISVWENLQNNVLKPAEVNDFMQSSLKRENVEQNINLLLHYYPELFWRFNQDTKRQMVAKSMEPLLWNKMKTEKSSSLKAAFYHTWLSTAFSKQAIKKMLALWTGGLNIPGLILSENDRIKLSYELAVRKGMPGSKIIPRDILQQQLKQTKNPDKQKEIAFVMPALNENIGIRSEFFERLKEPHMRRHEPWVITAVSYLHHPLRAASSEKFILPSLEMLQEIQQTGDIFFPKAWLDATFHGHHSKESVKIINEYLEKNHDINPKLLQKILQSTDPVIRASKILYGKSNEKKI